MRRGFEFLEHTADVYVAAYGLTFEEALENAALALFETMTDTTVVRQENTDLLQVKAEDEIGLLYSWLETLLKRFEIDGYVYSKFRVKIRKEPQCLHLCGEAVGEPFDPTRHPSRTEVKAVTYHRMSIRREAGGVTVEFILDI